VANEEDSILEMYTGARTAMIVIIYVISIVFSLVVVMMFCKKAFLQERRDIGIYKSLGFTSGKLRMQFAIRFLIVSLIGSALGTVLSLFFTEPVLKAVFRIIGVWFSAKFSPIAFIVPVAIIAVSFFSFSYLASRKIKRVEIKELVIE
jgi:ABC-type antimicrobial peptide transport system permease subunit